MAGLDDGYSGEARLTPGFTVGYLAQEPQLDPAKDVKGNVMDGVAAVQSLIDRYNEVMAKWADPDADYDKIGAQQADLEDKIAAADAGAWSATSRSPWTRCAARPTTPTSPRSPAASAAASRCAACCFAGPTCCCSTSRPTTSTPRASSGWSSFLQEYPGTVVAITHDRYFLDNVAKWILELDRGRGIPFEGNYRRGWSRSRSAWPARRSSNEARRRTLDRELEWVRMAPKARQAKGKARLTAYDKLQAEAEAPAATTSAW